MDGPHEALALSPGRSRVTDDDPVFAAWIEGELDHAYRLATVILGSAIEAEDAVSDAALAAWRSRGRLRDPTRFEPWFGRILVNGCRDRLRARRRRPVAALPPGEVGGPWLSRTRDVGDEVARRDSMTRAFEMLEPDERIVPVLRFWHDLTVDAIAERVGIPAGTVKSRLHHATARLRAALTALEVDR
jgi:RNA polymerase sigma-70 factor (ECF subfamily)